MVTTLKTQDNHNARQWEEIFKNGGPRNYYPHSYVVSWYFKYVHSLLDKSIKRNVLDIGCGTAPDLILFNKQGVEYYGIDVTEFCFNAIINAINSWKLNPDLVHLQLFSSPKLPFDDQFFNMVIGLESIHFNNNRKSMHDMVNEVYRVLKPQGHFFFTTVDRDHYFVKSPYSKFIDENCLEITEGFPEKHRVGLRYYVFSGHDQIRDLFSKFGQVKIGKYLLDTADGQPDSYYVIFGIK
jgi:SAM-dependent methyltransferase